MVFYILLIYFVIVFLVLLCASLYMYLMEGSTPTEIYWFAFIVIFSLIIMMIPCLWPFISSHNGQKNTFLKQRQKNIRCSEQHQSLQLHEY